MNINNVIIGSVGTLVLYGGYRCYNLYQKYNDILENIQNKICDSVDNVKIHDHYIDITYHYYNTMYNIRLPYDQTKVSKTGQYMVIGKDLNGEEIELTHQPGIPYLYNAEEMGLQSIEIYDLLNDTLETYTGTQIPGYGNI
jgi:hypothetical protein